MTATATHEDAEAPLLSPATLAALGRLRLSLRRRVDGRFVGSHRATGFGSSLDFADYREYSPGDDLRLLDPNAHARLGKLLIRLFQAEDQAALRVVCDTSASMAGSATGTRTPKNTAARQIAAALAALALAGGDRVRVLLAGDTVDAGPWYAGRHGYPAAEARLRSAPAAAKDADLGTALRRAHGEGPRGPVVLISDLLTDDWQDVVALLGGVRTDATLIHVLARSELEPDLDGDVRLVDVESGNEVEVAVSGTTLAAFRKRRDDWLDGIQRQCGARGITYVRHLDDESLDSLLTDLLPRLGLVA